MSNSEATSVFLRPNLSPKWPNKLHRWGGLRKRRRRWRTPPPSRPVAERREEGLAEHQRRRGAEDEEVVELDGGVLPEEGWGELLLWRSAPITGRAWTDDATTRDRRQLKHRSVQDTRPVPAPPPLVHHLREHIRKFGVAPDGRIFRSQRNNGPVGDSLTGSIWRQARTIALTPAQVASPLARRPYDLRHAAVSLWANAGVAPQQVAEWPGHSVNVLLRVYAKCLDGEQAAARRRIEVALKLESNPPQVISGDDAEGEGLAPDD